MQNVRHDVQRNECHLFWDYNRLHEAEVIFEKGPIQVIFMDDLKSV